MRALIQRVKEATVSIKGSVHNEIGKGFLIFLGISHKDTKDEATYLAQRCADIRIFGDEQEKMNLSINDCGGSALVISQFTLYADTRKGNRPSFTDAATPDVAESLYEEFIGRLMGELGEPRVKKGVFRAMMDVKLINDGPVTILIESKEKEQ